MNQDKRTPIKRRRQELGYTQNEIAKQCEISQSHFSEIEKGMKSPSDPVKVKIAAALRSDVQTLFFDCYIAFSDQIQMR
ncbi:helix-turn-helix domain-containing protein [Tumebacillus permanentifrigoris]|uniref:DNA-binding XRE family transcriptional regulator n=1 Tax=Tumebacillus permanentifrigoris TaxID=378543 RepID=A0A316DPQ3_9BACL|nr:helix-turn-helix transcriptional regulator [Tumebacillus permanentifrigoris]PWK05085.1 DNA-binding XRE family transcriptional regulator [Tumebacillus permanentifrigoris]